MQIINYTLLTHDNVFLVQTSLGYYVTKFIEIFSYQGCKCYTLVINFVMKEKKKLQLNSPEQFLWHFVMASVARGANPPV